MTFLDYFYFRPERDESCSTWTDLAVIEVLDKPVIFALSSGGIQPFRMPKRVRRQHVELRFLRQEVVVLERKLSLLLRAKGDPIAAHNLWRLMAEEQAEQRTHTELENERLKAQLDEVSEVRLALELLQKRS